MPGLNSFFDLVFLLYSQDGLEFMIILPQLPEFWHLHLNKNLSYQRTFFHLPTVHELEGADSG